MRNDVKIGIAVGVFVIVIGLVWFVFLSERPDSEGDTGEREETVPGFEIEPEPPVAVVSPPADQPPAGPPEDSAAPAGPAEVAPGPGPVAALAPIDSGPAERPPVVVDFTGPDDGGRTSPRPSPLVVLTEPPVTDGGPASLPRHDPHAGPALAPSTPRTSVRRPLTARGSDEPSDLAIAPIGHVGEAVEPETDGATATAPAGRGRVYVVKEGDDGFWAISKEVYGAGKHWELIRDANPDADTNALRPGQELVIPPLPAPEPQEIAREDLPTGAPPGSDTYVVKDGDSYWKIAEGLYGRGDYFYLLEQANGIDAGNLRPGMVLVVPPRPEAPPEAATERPGERETPAGEEITAGPGEEIYTVVAGDSYWKIARNVYGQGHLWPAIRDANPDVDPQTMQPGKRLLIPSIEVARRAVGEDSSGATETDGVSDEPEPGRPVFD